VFLTRGLHSFSLFADAGAGGRNRGQNRTAKQSYHQTWDSLTNASLRRNQQSGRPVRVIRGPKCNSKFGTLNSGGGYRYDGLFNVEKAEMVPTGSRMLKTAFFTLRKIRDE
jgi:E3 ubiquitin-protein ligase UHRF1